MVLGLIVQWRLKSKFSAYSKIQTASGLSGKEVAEKMLHDSGIFDVTVTSVSGFLNDHYDPIKKTVNLSPDVYEGKNVAAAAVAARACKGCIKMGSINLYNCSTCFYRITYTIHFNLPGKKQGLN